MVGGLAPQQHRANASKARLPMPSMRPTIKIRFTEPPIALVMRAHPNCNLDRLTEVCFEFDQAGKIVG
jgi:hypothetical protein